ncbi:CBS domain-containing protein [Thalassobacillus devorans]|uniref:CBS domain-containing protein n=1 Tax=Thalassobacillus devorans TaxID=279813 RepID=A0ABQ1NM13_9BACI|nr:cyclic-di-AMP-binding protein CbpB [Thalassobacillus devorans]NIK27721.1 putative transcriptional regulator [Thalassobacillus devorans]GGC79978.1 CBS domain-containing protein [Thalassobacillus devorans]
MINVPNDELLHTTVNELMIPADKVAHVQVGNPLEHALLVLVKTGYSAVPVLDAAFKLKGTISKAAIIEQTLGIEQFEFNKLSEMCVNTVMKTEIPILHRDDSFEKALKYVIDNPFVCVADEEGSFDGILTRRAILKQLNRYLHTETNLLRDKVKG